MEQTKMKEIIVVLFAIALVSGIIHTIRYSSPLHYFGFATIASLYGLAFAGLMTMWQSAKCLNKKKRWLMLFVGFISIFISYFSLEILYPNHMN